VPTPPHRGLAASEASGPVSEFKEHCAGRREQRRFAATWHLLRQVNWFDTRTKAAPPDHAGAIQLSLDRGPTGASARAPRYLLSQQAANSSLVDFLAGRELKRLDRPEGPTGVNVLYTEKGQHFGDRGPGNIGNPRDR
jgi:hypothetical protein